MQYVNVQNDTAILSVMGVFRFNCCKAVEADLNTAFQNGCTKVIVDFSDTTFIDSASIRLLCDVRDKLHAENFSARNAKGRTLTTLRAGNLDSWLKA